MNPFIVYINGEFFNHEKAKISVLDLGLTRGYGVFDFFRTYNSIPFHLNDHLKRLKKSALLVGIEIPKEIDSLESVIEQLMKFNKLKEAAIKIILTGGVSAHSLFSEAEPTLICYTLPLPKYPDGFHAKGVKLISYKHNPYLSECKSLNYLPAVLSIQHARKHDAFESLYIDANDHILEGSTSNFFAFKKGVLITPSQSILFGITRDVILKLAKDIFPIEERLIKKEELQEFDEVFTSSSNKEILPVRQIDDLMFPIGKNTQKIAQLFHHYTRPSTLLDS